MQKTHRKRLTAYTKTPKTLCKIAIPRRARRGDGGMPISIMGAGSGVFAAGKLAGDTDALPSMIDDSVRRMMVSLPDMRKL